MKRRLIGLLISILLVASLIGCTTGSYTATLATEKNTSTSMAMTYAKMNGHKTASLSIEDNEILEVDVDVVSKDGQLDLSIVNEQDESFYQGTDMPTSSFTVTLDKKGKYKITVNAKDHKGSYNITWKNVN